jgi:3-deoxy-D-manno-octulosonate 8-phosphate phosphatase (KDO 8-P phosphatase)
MTTPKIFILDVDGVLTSGSFLYNKDGKYLKVFGPDDNDGLKLLNKKLEILFITGDKKGFEISKKRIVDDMGYPLFLVSTINRIDWIQKRYNPKEVIYMGDGIFDSIVMSKVGYSISPSNGDEYTKKCADFITKRSGGDRAVAEACIHILMKFYDLSNREEIINNNFKEISEAWVG